MIPPLLQSLVTLVLVVVACGAGTGDDNGGIGGTGLGAHKLPDPHSLRAPAPLSEDSDGRGIGGTGLQAGTDGRGIGGTGIVGTITAFGSIWVNDLEVHYSRNQAISIFDGTGSTSDLRVGQVVAVVADDTGSGRLQARDIGVLHAVAGPVSTIDQRAGAMTLLGQQVLLPQDDPLASSLRPGDRVAVSGLRDDRGRIIASRLDPVPPDVSSFIRGTVERSYDNQLIVGGKGFKLPRGMDRGGLETGREIVLYGDPDGQGLRVRNLKPEPELPFDGRVSNLVIEGVVRNRGRRIGPLRLPGSLSGVKTGERVLVRGRVGADRRLKSESIRLERILRRQERMAPPTDDRSMQAPSPPRAEPRRKQLQRRYDSGSAAEDNRRRKRAEKTLRHPQRTRPPRHPVRPPLRPWRRSEPWRRP